MARFCSGSSRDPHDLTWGLRAWLGSKEDELAASNQKMSQQLSELVRSERTARHEADVCQDRLQAVTLEEQRLRQQYMHAYETEVATHNKLAISEEKAEKALVEHKNELLEFRFQAFDASERAEHALTELHTSDSCRASMTRDLTEALSQQGRFRAEAIEAQQESMEFRKSQAAILEELLTGLKAEYDGRIADLEQAKQRVQTEMQAEVMQQVSAGATEMSSELRIEQDANKNLVSQLSELKSCSQRYLEEIRELKLEVELSRSNESQSEEDSSRSSALEAELCTSLREAASHEAQAKREAETVAALRSSESRAVTSMEEALEREVSTEKVLQKAQVKHEERERRFAQEAKSWEKAVQRQAESLEALRSSEQHASKSLKETEEAAKSKATQAKEAQAKLKELQKTLARDEKMKEKAEKALDKAEAKMQRALEERDQAQKKESEIETSEKSEPSDPEKVDFEYGTLQKTGRGEEAAVGRAEVRGETRSCSSGEG
eukprot:TRINITY_DN28392_c0_g1_i1.p1 TRINITY_DN28392_c0_g1~~TRINITY_DN28392_c0_g1_i1.p1  ORF type:complete len:493 (-),score=157.98 TRINITY_DN28392_c0_g1_i1:115-1593(-)